MKSKELFVLLHRVRVFGDHDFVRAERRASAALPGEVVKGRDFGAERAANFTPMWPRPPRPTTPTFWPVPTSQWRSGE